MAVGYSSTVRNGRLNVVRNNIDAGGGGAGLGTLKFYDGARPATGGAATTLLATCTFANPSAPDATGGVLTFNAIADDASADATGTATWARIADSAGVFVADVSVGLTGSGADIELNSVDIVAGAAVSVTSATITAGNA